MALDQVECLKTMESDRHAARGQEESLGERGWGERADQLELGEHFEVSSMAQAVGGGNAVQSGLEKVRGAEYPAHYLRRREVDAGAGFLPPLHDVVKTIGHKPNLA